MRTEPPTSRPPHTFRATGFLSPVRAKGFLSPVRAKGFLSPVRATRGLAATATTLVALVAMSATVSAGPTPTRAPEAQARLESHVVRAVAAAVAAAARDLLAGQHPTVVAARLEPAPQTGLAAGRWVRARPGSSGGTQALLAERLLDLPPPIC